MKCPNCKVNIPDKCNKMSGLWRRDTNKSSCYTHTGKSHTQYNKPNQQYNKYTKKQKSNGSTVEPQNKLLILWIIRMPLQQ